MTDQIMFDFVMNNSSKFHERIARNESDILARIENDSGFHELIEDYDRERQRVL